MAANFEIKISENKDGFSLELEGDFDATSAYELIYAIKKLPERTEKIHVQTNGLKKIHPFGVDVLSGYMNSLGGHPARIVFAGRNASQLSLGISMPTHKASNFFLKELGNEGRLPGQTLV